MRRCGEEKVEYDFYYYYYYYFIFLILGFWFLYSPNRRIND